MLKHVEGGKADREETVEKRAGEDGDEGGMMEAAKENAESSSQCQQYIVLYAVLVFSF